MRKTSVIIITIILLAGFGGLVFYALRHGQGVPVTPETIERVVLEVPFIDTEIDLRQGIQKELWQGIAGEEIKLIYQMMYLPWPKKLTPSVTLKAFHNKNEIYFHLAWLDDTEDRVFGMNKFSDACGIMFPLKDEVQPATIMMGFMGRANIWQWKASQDREFWLRELPVTGAYADYHYPFEDTETLPVSRVIPKSSANDLIAIRAGTITPKEAQDVSARGFWQDGVWKVALKRKLKAEDSEIDAVFNAGKKRLCGFAVWNGANGDRGGRKSISEFVELDIK